MIRRQIPAGSTYPEEMNSGPRLTRRGFLRSSAATAGAIAFPTIIPSGVLGRNAPSKRINIGAIGVGSRSGGVNIGGISRFNDVRIIACADPIKDRQIAFAEKVNKIYRGDYCRKFSDFRELLKRDDRLVPKCRQWG